MFSITPENILSSDLLDEGGMQTPKKPSRFLKTVQSDNESSRSEVADLLDETPKKQQRTFIFSSAYIPPFSKRNPATGNGPSARSQPLSPSLLASHAFGPPAPRYDFSDRIAAPDYAPSYYRALKSQSSGLGLLTPNSGKGSTPDILLPQPLSDPELSVGSSSDLSDEQKSIDSPTSPILSRIQPAADAKTNSNRSGSSARKIPPYTPLNGAQPSLNIVLRPGLDLDSSSDSVVEKPYRYPPPGTFRSSHARRLRSETYAEARERARVRERRVRRSRSDTTSIIADQALGPGAESGQGGGREKTPGDGYATDIEEESDGSPSEDFDFKDIVLGISELDVFGAGMILQNLDRYTSSPWRRSVRAPLPSALRGARQSIPTPSNSREAEMSSADNGICSSAPS